MPTTVTTTGITFNDATTQTTAKGLYTNYVASGASGTWTVPSGVTRVSLMVCGGGGGNNGAFGGTALLTHVSVTPGQVITYAVGAGGSSTGNGGNSTITIAGAVACTALGGTASGTDLGSNDSPQPRASDSLGGFFNGNYAGAFGASMSRQAKFFTEVDADLDRSSGPPLTTLSGLVNFANIHVFFYRKTRRRPAGNGTTGVAWTTASAYSPGAAGSRRNNSNDQTTNQSAGIGGAFFAIW